jgi:hypothetical protein
MAPSGLIVLLARCVSEGLPQLDAEFTIALADESGYHRVMFQTELFAPHKDVECLCS